MSASPSTDWLGAWRGSRVLRQAFTESLSASRDVLAGCASQIRSPAETPPAFRVSLTSPAPDAFDWRRHLFSTLFHAVYILLDVPAPQRALLGRINYLFRIWVTAADNLLDGESKPTLPLDLPAGARVMPHVVAIMAADRCLAALLRDAVRDGVLTQPQADHLLERTLGALLPSAAQEAGEEAGVIERPPPEDVLSTIHQLKTGILFRVPFVGLDGTGLCAAPPARLARLRGALTAFGVGCQVIDDIRDLALDLAMRRHNYLLSALAHGDPARYAELLRRAPDPGARLYRELPDLVRPAARVAKRHLEQALDELRAEGLDVDAAAAQVLSAAMFTVLDVEDAADA